MKKKFTQDISANSIQLLINQLCGLAIFYVLSVFLDKTNFGEINWTLAVMLTLFGILACGIDQVAIRKIASGQNESEVLSTYIFHVVFSGLSVYALLLTGRFLFPGFFEQHQLLLLIGIGKLAIFFSTPFKQLATGLEKFKALLFMAVCSNLVRSIALLLIVAFSKLSMQAIVIIFIAGDICELLLCLFITKRSLKIPLNINWDKKAYKALVKESLPQLGVAIFTSVMSRFDWIFLGLFTSNIVVANYSFAYKLFEVSSLPLLVIAPVLIPRFTKLFHSGSAELTELKRTDLFILLRLEMVIASFTALVLNILWGPVIDALTQGKYGAVNKQTILILSAGLPFLYLNNYLWTNNFAKGRLKMIFYSFLISFIVNLTADIMLIPFLGAEGAALGCLIALATQSIVYLYNTRLEGLHNKSWPVLIAPACAVASWLLAISVADNAWLLLFAATAVFIALLLATRQLRFTDFAVLKRITGL